MRILHGSQKQVLESWELGRTAPKQSDTLLAPYDTFLTLSYTFLNLPDTIWHLPVTNWHLNDTFLAQILFDFHAMAWTAWVLVFLLSWNVAYVLAYLFLSLLLCFLQFTWVFFSRPGRSQGLLYKHRSLWPQKIALAWRGSHHLVTHEMFYLSNTVIKY